MPTEAYLFSSAGVIQWQNASFPSWTSPVRPRPPALIEALDSSGVSFLARAASVSSESKVPGRFRFCKALLRLAVARSAASTDKRIEFVGDYLGLGVVPLDHLETPSRLATDPQGLSAHLEHVRKVGMSRVVEGPRSDLEPAEHRHPLARVEVRLVDRPCPPAS
jgi:hypothetical protein